MATFVAFLLAYLLSQFFRSFLAVVALELRTELGLDAADLGNISAAWFAGFAIAQFPIGSALDRFGPRRTVPLFMLSASVGAALFAAATTVWGFIVAMALIGVGCGPVLMGAVYYFGRMLPPDRFPMIIASFLATGSLGNLLSATPLAMATTSFGWRNTFLGVAVATLISTVLVYLIVRDPPRALAASGHETTRRSGFLEVLGIRGLWPMLPLVIFSYAVIAAERGLWLGPYLTQVYALDTIASGNAALIMSLAMSAGALAYGPLEKLAGSRKIVVMIGSLVTAAGFLALALIPDLSSQASICLLAVVGFSGLTYGVLISHGRLFLPDRLLGRGITLLNFLFMAGAVALQLTTGPMVAQLAAASTPPVTTFATLHLVFGLLLLVATLIYVLTPERNIAKT